MKVILQYGILCCLISFYTRFYAQGEKIEDKIDPVFKVLIAKQKPGQLPTTLWLELAVPIVTGKPYVSRHYEITPLSGASDATGKVTLYFTQADFNAFNAHPGSSLNLPANPSDILGKSNLRIGQNLEQAAMVLAYLNNIPKHIK